MGTPDVCMSCTNAVGNVPPGTLARGPQAQLSGISLRPAQPFGHVEADDALVRMLYMPFSLSLELSPSPCG